MKDEELELPPDLMPCCWKPIQRFEDYIISERLCDQACDHEHHKIERETERDGPVLIAKPQSG